MFQYHKTNGPHGEIAIECDGQFLGFIRNLGRADRWAAYDRQLNLLGEGYGSRAQAATACRHDCIGKKRIAMRDILEAARPA
jgi:hypothetical protein